MKIALYDRQAIRDGMNGWLRYGFCPIEFVVRDLGCPGCPRPCVFGKFCGVFGQDLFLGELPTVKAAKRYAKACGQYLGRHLKAYDQLPE